MLEYIQKKSSPLEKGEREFLTAHQNSVLHGGGNEMHYIINIKYPNSQYWLSYC